MEQGYSLKRVHKMSLFAIYCISVVFSLKILLFDDSKVDLLYTGVIVIVATAVYFLPMKDFVKGFFFGFIPTLVAIAMLLIGGFYVANHYLFMISIAIITLYFSHRLLFVYGIALDLLLIASFLIDPVKTFGNSNNLPEMLSVMVMLNGSLFLLMVLCKWGREIIQQATEKGKEATLAADALSMTMDQIDKGTQILGENTKSMASNADASLSSSKQVATAMQEIALGVQDQAQSVSDINMQVNVISEDVNRAHDISNTLTETNESMMAEVTSGEAEIERMKDQMQIIDEAIESAIITVKDLEGSMADIQNFLEVITNISSQTNLLALNASIESARAGEAGKGFAVVADEIRKLAEQSSESVQDINAIVEAVGKKTQEAVQTVNHGNNAVLEGTEIIKTITDQYSTIKTSFVSNNSELEREITMINKINETFKVVHDKISNIASISEEQSASTEEILATVENQALNIENLTHSLNDIEDLSNSLTMLISDNKTTD